MKAHWNRHSQFSIIAQTVLLLCCITLLIPQSALAQDRTASEDENGRPSTAMPGMVIPARADQIQGDDLSKGCDADVCNGVASRDQSPNQAITDDLSGARTLTPTGTLSFQIQAGAPTNSVHIADDGDVGIGTQSPMGRLHVVARPGEADAADVFLLDANGNLEIGGLLTEASSVLLKENFVTIDGQDVLDRLARLPITTWNYKTDHPSVRHMGPMAQDFYAAFGLGQDDEHLAPLDANGVALAGVQALAQQVTAQAAHIATLEQQNAELLQRLQALEALVQQRDE